MAHKLLIDINVILDVAMKRLPHYQSSQVILSLADQKKVRGFLSAASCSTIYYFIRKDTRNVREAGHYIQKLMRLLSIVAVDQDILDTALAVQMPDFEDAIQLACAESCGADFIVTRDASGYRGSHIKALTPDEYLATFTP